MLSPRLAAIAAFISSDDIVADIGSDHGKLPLYLNELGHTYVYASENKSGPYNRLKKEIGTPLNGQIEVALKDGLNDLPPHINTVVIAGMGGELIGEILSRDTSRLESINKLVLAPNGGEQNLRRLLSFLGFTIVNEKVIEDKGQFYEIMVAINAPCPVCGVETLFGAINLAEKSAPFLNKWQQVYDRNNDLLTNVELDQKKRSELLEMQKQIEKAIKVEDES
ncbi:MAG: class I SAM-dependent methyltransferase [Bacilli bacterium]